MAWTVTLSSAAKTERNVVATFQFSDGAETINEVVPRESWDAASLKDYAFRRVAQLNARDTSSASILPLVGTTITPEVATVSGLEQARIANRAAMGLKQMANTYTDAAVLTSLNNRIGVLQAALKAFMQANPSVNPEDLL